MERWVTIFLITGGALTALGQSGQTVTDISSYSLTHTSIRWTYRSDLPCGQVKFGTRPGEYRYSSYSYCTQDSRKSFAVGGLAPSTTYYFRIAARPNQGNDDGICQVDACGSPEQVITTLPEPEVHPQLPEPPKEWIPTKPDTTGYFIIPMKLDDVNGTECVAAQTVAGTGVVANDSIDRILQVTPYGSVLEFPQGITCIVDPSRNIGYKIPYKPIDPAVSDIDSPDHKWIVLRTAQNSPADFPPYGSRTGASFAPKLAKFVAVKPTYIGSPGVSGRGYAQIFSAEEGGGQHHFWFENLEFTTTDDPELLPAPGTIDPPPYSQLFGIFPTFPTRIPPDIAYIVLDRIYIHGQGYPSRYTRGVTLGGRNQAMIGCSLENLDFWQMPITPQEAPSLSEQNTVMTIPAVNYSLNAHDTPVGLTQSATATLTASNSYEGKYILQLGPEQGSLRLLYDAPTAGTASVACEGCTAVQQPDATQSLDPTGFSYCRGTISNGQFSTPSCSRDIWETTSYGFGWGTIGLELYDGGTGPYYIENNFMGAVGMGVYVDTGGLAGDGIHKVSYVENSNDDVIFRHNHLMFGEDHRITSDQSNGFRYPIRNLFETKRAKRWLIQGNLFQNFWTYQNDGSAILLAGSFATYAIDNAVTGVLDQKIVSNIIRHGATGIQSIGALGTGAAAEQPGNLLVENNLLYDLEARYKYTDQALSLYTGVFAMGGSRDVTIRHNTAGLTLGQMPALLYGDTSGLLMEGLSYTDNLLYLSKGGVGGGIWIGEWAPTHPRLPAIDRSSYKTQLETAYVRTGDQVTPNYEFARNVIIGGKTYPGAGFQQTDMTDQQIMTAQSLLPGNYFPITGTNSMQDREKAVGLLNPEHWDYRLSSSSPYRAAGQFSAPDGKAVGVDYDQLQQDQGLVTNIGVSRLSESEAVFQYTAPDSRACVVDVSGDNVNWTRVTDGGGERDRLVQVPLNRSTSFAYRVLCYYRQINDGILYTEYPADQITDGIINSLRTTNRRR